MDAPYALEPETKLLVVVLPELEGKDEREDWPRSSASGLERAYSDDEIEYSPALVKEANAEYTPRA